MSSKEILKLYHEEIPSFLLPYLDSMAMQRLKGIDMNCGVNYTSYPLFALKKPYRRFEHCLGTALIAWHFSNDRKQALASLFHDIATPCFAHVVDFMHGDHIRQESTEERTLQILAEDETVMSLLKKDGISLEEVCDYHIYPLCDNDSPRLSADRLEYTCGNMMRYGFAEADRIKMLYDNLCAGTNEEREAELMFTDSDIALAFGRGALACGRIYSSNEHRYAMESLAGILKTAVKEGIISEDDLYSDEARLIQVLENSPLGREWRHYTGLRGVSVKEAYEEGCLKVQAKKRYIDPFVRDQGRLSTLDSGFREEIRMFLAVDHDVWLKGVYDE